ncbi:hypothetical protein [Okeania sp. KiyG1]|nr:hypothetical protein [Okeania sp. KiyG1]
MKNPSARRFFPELHGMTFLVVRNYGGNNGKDINLTMREIWR